MADKKENALVKAVNSRALALVVEPVKTFGNIALAPLKGPVRRFGEGFRDGLDENDGNIARSIADGYSKAIETGDEDGDGFVTGASVIGGLGGAVASACFAPGLLLGAGAATAAKIGVGAAALLLAAPVSFVLIPVVGLAIATAVCTGVAAVWSVPISLAKGLNRIFSRTKQEKAIAKMKREAKKKKFDVHVVDRDAPGGMPVAGALTQKHSEAQAKTTVPATTQAQEMKYGQ